MLFLGNNKHVYFHWTVQEEESTLLRSFLNKKGISKRLLAKVKYQGGHLLVNDEEVTVRKQLALKDEVTVVFPVEKDNERLTPSYKDIDILFEDDHYLIVNKPAGVAAVPSPTHREDTMANRVKGYALNTQSMQSMIHVVTRLDRETSGAMIFAKHSFAHAQLDLQLRSKELKKYYLAILEGRMELNKHGLIEEPIARSESSIITRKVHPSGKESLTEYWVRNVTNDHTVVEVQLHTGRTHQIRVHFSHLGFPLLGDDLYGGSLSIEMDRQALHCAKLSFEHPFMDKQITVKAPLPMDLEKWLGIRIAE